MERRAFRLRVTYVKQGRLSYLSHLEITHALERMIRRSGLPYCLTEGFSPHMRISFGSALGVGVGSTCEVFDIKLLDYVSPQKALNALRRQASADMAPIDAQYVDEREPAASVAFPYSVYVAQFHEEVPDFFIPEKVTVTRKKKHKVLNVDDFLVDDPIICEKRLVFQLRSSSTGSLRPDILLQSCELPDPKSLTRVKQSVSPVDLNELMETLPDKYL